MVTRREFLFGSFAYAGVFVLNPKEKGILPWELFRKKTEIYPALYTEEGLAYGDTQMLPWANSIYSLAKMEGVFFLTFYNPDGSGFILELPANLADQVDPKKDTHPIYTFDQDFAYYKRSLSEESKHALENPKTIIIRGRELFVTESSVYPQIKFLGLIFIDSVGAFGTYSTTIAVKVGEKKLLLTAGHSLSGDGNKKPFSEEKHFGTYGGKATPLDTSKYFYNDYFLDIGIIETDEIDDAFEIYEEKPQVGQKVKIAGLTPFFSEYQNSMHVQVVVDAEIISISNNIIIVKIEPEISQNHPNGLLSFGSSGSAIIDAESEKLIAVLTHGGDDIWIGTGVTDSTLMRKLL